jgi:hypothetical protein
MFELQGLMRQSEVLWKPTFQKNFQKHLQGGCKNGGRKLISNVGAQPQDKAVSQLRRPQLSPRV